MKKTIVFMMLFYFLSTSFSFALDLNTTANYLAKQELDAWGILALYSNGSSIQNQSLEKVNSSTITTDYESYIMGAIPLGVDVSEYTKQIAATQQENGKFADYIDGKGSVLLNSHIWGIISLYAADFDTYDKTKALQWLKDNQNQDGGFPVFVKYPISDPDLTAMAIIAYRILGLDKNAPEIKKAFDFIEKELCKTESCEAISWLVLAKKYTDSSIEPSLCSKLLSYKMKDGSFKHLKESENGSYIATWHALLALSDYHNEISVFDQLHNDSKQHNHQKENENRYDSILPAI